jgi:hypothetical protein
MCIDPMVVGYIAVMIAERLGAHTGAVAKAFVNRTPWLANLSRLGVRA